MPNWLDTSEVDRFVDEIVGDLVKRFPPLTGGTYSKKEIERLTKTHKSILDRVERFAAEHKLNIFKKARLGNRFKWALKEAGYEPMVVDAFTQEVVTIATLARKGK
jgi:hypothetical protein